MGRTVSYSAGISGTVGALDSAKYYSCFGLWNSGTQQWLLPVGENPGRASAIYDVCRDALSRGTLCDDANCIRNIRIKAYVVSSGKRAADPYQHRFILAVSKDLIK